MATSDAPLLLAYLLARPRAGNFPSAEADGAWKPLHSESHETFVITGITLRRDRLIGYVKCNRNGRE